MDDAHGEGSSVEEDHQRDTHWRRPEAPGVTTQEDDEHSGREGRVHEPQQVTQEMVETQTERQTRTEGRRRSMAGGTYEAVKQEAVTDGEEVGTMRN